jgi:glc operon protein GlcG
LSPLGSAPRASRQAKMSQWLAAGNPQLTLEAADTMASAAIAECKSKGFKDVSVFVLDGTGRTLVSKTMLGVPPLIPAIAEAKAGAAIGTHASSRALKDKYVPDRTPQLLAMTTIGAATAQPFAAVPGGVLCRDTATGAVIGAIGVSGASADEDEHCAIVGAQACMFKTEPAKSALQ